MTQRETDRQSDTDRGRDREASTDTYRQTDKIILYYTGIKI